MLSQFFRRLALKALMNHEKTAVSANVGLYQYGVGCSDGAGKLTKALRVLSDKDPSRVLVSMDIKAAFQNLNRDRIITSLNEHANV